MHRTRPRLPRISLLFDFDLTLAADSVDAIVALYGIDRETWEREHKEPLGDGWDEITRRGHGLIALGQAAGRPLTREIMAEAARSIEIYPGVTAMPGHLRGVARAIADDIEVEFCVLSSGFEEVIEPGPVGEAFERVFAGAMHFGPGGEAVCVKRIVTHPQKALYLQAYGKNVEEVGDNAPECAGRTVDEYDRRVPFDQMVYLGDGDSDLLAFQFMTGAGGLAVAIGGPGRFDAVEEMAPEQRVDAVHEPDYTPGSPLMDALERAVSACAYRIALRAGE